MRKLQVLTMTAAMVVTGATAAIAADAPANEPVTASYEFAEGDPGLRMSLDNGGMREVDALWHFEPLTSSDARLDGPATFATTQDTLGDLEFFVRVGRIETADGGWTQEPTWTISGGPDEDVPLETVWVGDGAYDGLLLLADWTFDDLGFNLDGHIITADLPQVSTPAASS